MHFAGILDRSLSSPLNRQLYEQWRQGILTGRFRPGERVPSTRELAESLCISRGTVSEAWDQLIAEGYLETSPGSGTFVSRELPDRTLMMARAGRGQGASDVTVKLSRYGAGLTEDWHRASRQDAIIRFSPGIPDRRNPSSPIAPALQYSSLMKRNLISEFLNLIEFLVEGLP
jgi:GntR family transcriptional regulator/MocR family aminotransferase